MYNKGKGKSEGMRKRDRETERKRGGREGKNRNKIKKNIQTFTQEAGVAKNPQLFIFGHECQ